MRVMVLVKANEQTEKGEPPKQEMLEAMMAFNEELVKAGVILDGDGLTPSSQGGTHIVERNLTRLTIAVALLFAGNTVLLFHLLK